MDANNVISIIRLSALTGPLGKGNGIVVRNEETMQEIGEYLGIKQALAVDTYRSVVDLFQTSNEACVKFLEKYGAQDEVCVQVSDTETLLQ